MLKRDANDSDGEVSCLDLVAFIKSDCTDVTKNLEELFRRSPGGFCMKSCDPQWAAGLFSGMILHDLACFVSAGHLVYSIN